MKAMLLHFRTFLFALAALGFLLAGLYLCLRYPAAGVAIFTAFAGAVFAIVGAVATKSAVEHLGDGVGLKNAIASLMTDVKPDAPPETKP